MKLEAIVWSQRHGCWLKPPMLAGARLLRGANAAAVLDCTLVKGGELDFGEGAEIRLLAEGETVFRGRVFGKRRRQPELIGVRAYDGLRYLQNRDCCIFRDFSPGEMLKRICGECGLVPGDVADCGLRLGVRAYDGRRYLDMLGEVLGEVLQAKGRHYFIFDENGRICLRSCRDMQVNIVLTPECAGGYEYSTGIDRDCYNRVKVIYEDKRKGRRRQFVAEDREKLRLWGPLQLVSKNADAAEQSYAKAAELLRQGGRRLEEMWVREAPADLRVRGGSMVGVRWNLGEKLVDGWAIVREVEFVFCGEEALMNLRLELAEHF